MTWIWKKLGGIHFTVALCLLLAADLAWGYVCLNRRTTLFSPINDIGLAAWLDTYGRYNLVHTAWFFLLLALLTLLCINIFVCTTDRIVGLARTRAHFTSWRFIMKLAPHAMHYGMIIILIGYLSSYLFARVLETHTLTPGASMTLPGVDARVTFTSLDPEYYQGERLPEFKDRVLRPRARLSIEEGRHRRDVVLSITRPVRVKGHGLYLKDFAPKSKGGGMGREDYIDLTVRKDPGVGMYLAGILLFTAGLGVYLVEWVFFKKVEREVV